MINYKKHLLLSVITLIIFSTMIGVTYAFFSIKTVGNEGASTHLIKTASKEIRYSDGTLLANDKMEPGYNETKTITVENLGSKATTYNLIWQNVTNNLSRKQDLVYSLTCSSNIPTNTCSGLTQTQIPNTGTNAPVISNINIDIDEVHTYTVTVRYLMQSEDQSIDMNKTIVGKLGITE